jgi:hypothetical protein
LAPALDGASDPFDRARLCDAGPGKSQIQAVQVEIQALRVLDQTPSSSAPPALSSRLLQTSLDSSYGFDIKVISTIHASLFANSSAAAGTIR